MSVPVDVVAVDWMIARAEELARKYHIDDSAKDTLYMILDGLKKKHGEFIERRKAFAVLEQCLTMTRTGFKTEPVDIVEWVESPEYLGKRSSVRPSIMDKLIGLFDDPEQYIEIACGGAIGIGKDFFTMIALSYILYRMSCMYCPQVFYGLDPGTDIILMCQSKNESLAKRVIFKPLSSIILNCKYFKEQFPPDKRKTATLEFPMNISVIPLAGTDTAALGMNIFGGAIDEMTFMRVMGRNVKYNRHVNEGQADALYNTVIKRMKSRFGEFGRVPGKLFLLGSANAENSFIDRKLDEAERPGSSIFPLKMAIWESIPERHSSEVFWIMPPGEQKSGMVFEEKPTEYTEDDGLLSVPIDYLNDFKTDFIRSLRDIAGVSVNDTYKFVTRKRMRTAFDTYASIFGDGRQLFKSDTIQLRSQRDFEDILDLDFLRRLKDKGLLDQTFGAHVDLSLTKCNSGISIGTIVGYKDVGSRHTYDVGGEIVKQEVGLLPIIAIVGLLSIAPPSDGEMDLNVLRDYLILLSSYLPIKWATFDQFQSGSIRQALNKYGIKSSKQSLDKTPDPYRETRHAIREGRAIFPESSVLMMEATELEEDPTTGLFDHPQGGSKDLLDSTAAVVYRFMMAKSSYRNRTENLVRYGHDGSLIVSSTDSEGSDRRVGRSATDRRVARADNARGSRMSRAAGRSRRG